MQAGFAARIDFEPLKATGVKLPAGASFVVSNSLEESVKAVSALKELPSAPHALSADLVLAEL